LNESAADQRGLPVTRYILLLLAAMADKKRRPAQLHRALPLETPNTAMKCFPQGKALPSVISRATYSAALPTDIRSAA